MSDVDKVVGAVSEERLWQRVMAMAAYGATTKGGVNRQAASSEDAAAQNQLMLWGAARGFASFRDEIGNLFIRRDGEGGDSDADYDRLASRQPADRRKV